MFIFFQPTITTSPLPVDTPSGWSVEIEPHTREEIFLNSVTKEKVKKNLYTGNSKYLI